MPDPGTPTQAHSKLVRRLRKWEELVQEIEEISNPDLADEYKDVLPHKKRELRQLERSIDWILDNNPDIVPVAEAQGYDYEPQKPKGTKDDGAETGGGDGGPGKDPDGDGGDGDAGHLPGKRGRDYFFVKGPKGLVHVVFNMDIPGPKKGNISFFAPEELHDRYGIKPDEVRQLTAAQIKALPGFGPINEVKLRRGEHPFKSWMRMMERKFGAAPSMLKDKEVMQTLFAAHLGQWDQAELLGALQQTKWYDTKRTERVDWLFTKTSADKKTAINSTANQLTDYIRNAFGGVDWTKHGLNEKKIKQWSEWVASAKTGWDVSEVQSRIDNIARGIEGTSLWAQEEQAAEAALLESQEWEDFFEAYREKSITWLGPNARLSKETITDFAKKRAAGEITDADYDQLLRQQKRSLYPYITDPDMPWQQFVDPYRQALQSVTGNPVGYDNELLGDLGAKDQNGKPTGDPMSIYDWRLTIRDPERNPSAYEQGTPLYDQGQDLLAALLGRMTGVR